MDDSDVDWMKQRVQAESGSLALTIHPHYTRAQNSVVVVVAGGWLMKGKIDQISTAWQLPKWLEFKEYISCYNSWLIWSAKHNNSVMLSCSVFNTDRKVLYST